MAVTLGAQSSGYQGAELEEEVRTNGWAGSLGAPQNPVQAEVDQSLKVSEDPLKPGV